MVGILRRTVMIPLMNFAAFVYRTLLDGESAGLAVDFTDTTWFDRNVWDQEWVQVRTSPGNDAWSSPHTFFTNSGTSPKTVRINRPEVPHNLLQQSQTFENAYFSNINTTETANTTIAPDGTLTADTLTDDATNATHGIFKTVTSVISQDVFYTASCYVKQGTQRYAYVSIDNDPSGFTVFFDLQLGTLTSTDGAPTNMTVGTYGITSVGNGWYRIFVSARMDTGFANMYWQVGPSDDGLTPRGYSGTSKTIFIWGGQLNRGSTALTYVPTTTVAIDPGPPAGTLGWSPHNLCLQSQTLATSWVSGVGPGATITSNTSAAPDNTITAETLTIGSTSAAHEWQVSAAIVIQAGQIYNFSGYYKYNGSQQFAGLNIETDSGTIWISVVADLINGTITQASAGAGAVLISSSITSVGNGWYRISGCGTFGAQTNTYPTWAFNSSGTPTLGAFGADSYLGNGTNTFLAWGANYNRGIVPTAYIATTAAAVNGLPISYGEGLIVEPAATNLALHSQDTSTWDFSDTSGVISGNNTTAPDGSTTASKYTEDSTNSGHYVILPNVTTTASTSYTLSAYLKYSNSQFVSLYSSTAANQWFQVTVDLVNGTVTQTSDGSAATSSASSITSIGNGWYRVTVTGTVTGTSMNIEIALNTSGTPTLGATTGDEVYAGTGTKSLYWWGGQIELGTVATSYIPTTSATATRATDKPNVATSAYPHSATEGTMVEWVTPRFTSNPSFARLFVLSDGTANERIASFYQTASSPNPIANFITDGGVDVTDDAVTNAGAASLSGNKAAIFYKLNDSGVLVDGSSEVADTSCTMPTVTSLQLGYATDTALRELNGTIRRLIYVPRRMTTQQMKTATTL